MRRFWSVLATMMLASTTTQIGNAQTLQLGGPSAPELDKYTAASQLIDDLQAEIADHAAMERRGNPLQQLILRTGINYRLIAVDLLIVGDAVGHEGSLAVLTGYRLAQGRHDLEDSLRELVALTLQLESGEMDQPAELVEKIDDVTAALNRFNEDALTFGRTLPDATAGSIDRYVPAVFAPLARVIEMLESESVTNHWVAHDLVHPEGSESVNAETAPPESPETLEDLRGRIEAATLRDDTRDELATIMDFLVRGDQLPEFRPTVRAYHSQLNRLLQLTDAIDAAAWMNDETRDGCLQHIHVAVKLFGEKSTRDRGTRRIDRLDVSRSIIERITKLASYPRHRANLRPLAAALVAADAGINDPAQAAQGARLLDRLAVVLNRMIAYRELESPENLTREFRIVARDLEKAYLEAEKALLEEIDTLTTNPRALSDPAFTSLLADQKQYLEDHQRIGRLPEWVEVIRTIRPQAAPGALAQARKMSELLLVPPRRMDAILAMDQFEHQLKLFRELPFEASLRAREDAAVSASGGQVDRLVATITTQREQWADGWAIGDAGSEAAQRMLLLYRLTQLMADMGGVSQLNGDVGGLNAWAAWDLGPNTLASAVTDAPNRLRLATRAAIDLNDRELLRQLDRVDADAPVAKLVGRLWQTLQEPLRALPGGSAGVLGQVIHPPTERAWLIKRREDVAHLCRYAIEHAYARSAGRDALAGALDEYVNALADDLLEELGDRRAPLPTLNGFDGSDPDAEDVNGGMG